MIRAGAGLFYQPPFLEAFNNMADSAPFSPQVQVFRVPFGNPYASTVNPFPAQFAPSIPASNVAFDLPLSLAVSYERDWKPSRVMNWNFTVERQMAGDVLVRGVLRRIQRHASELQQRYQRAAAEPDGHRGQ